MVEPKVDMEFVRNSWEAPGHISAYADAGKIGLWDSERRLVSKYFFTADRILDIGCGAGRTTIALDRLGYSKVLGMDLSDGMIQRATSLAEQAGCHISFEVGDAIRLRYGDESFDGALFTAQGFMCIPGRDNRLLALKEARRVLRPGGHLIFTTHERHAARESASFWKEEKARWKESRRDSRLQEFGDRLVEDFGTWVFIHIPTRDEVEKMIQESGLVLVEDSMRSELCAESDDIQQSSSDCRMWVVQRPK